MKKFLAIVIVTALVAGLGAALAQSSQSHEVQINIPNVLMIRLTSGASNAAVSSPTAVVFDLSTVTFDPEDTYTPTNLSAANWDNVRVFANGGGWQVTVATNNDTFDWSKITVTPSGGDYTVNPFTLPVNDSVQIFTHGSRTNGWRSLGFGPAQFALALDGTEDAGTYTTTVTYTITNP
jgi:hypothetical protein